MEIVFTALVALVLLVLLVIALHRYQLSAAQSQVDRNLPLPPISMQIGQRRMALKPVHTEPSKSEHTDSRNVPAEKVTTAKRTTPQKTAKTNWLTQVSQLKKAGRPAEALTLCEDALPLWSAFQQSSILLRANLKAAQAANRPTYEDLKKLYQMAAVAALLHDRIKGFPSPTSAQLKQIDLTDILTLPMPYKEIGYLQLRLIKKSDIRLFLDNWGKPESHLSPREFHQLDWNEIVAGLGQRKDN